MIVTLEKLLFCLLFKGKFNYDFNEAKTFLVDVLFNDHKNAIKVYKMCKTPSKDFEFNYASSI